jgi:simple sugar transport system permease protein
MRNILAISADALGLMTPLLLAALGGLFTELAGMLNIALEGLITVGAFAAAAGALVSHNLVVGMAAGALASALAALAYGLASQRLKANEFVAGLATNLLAVGLTAAVSGRLLGNNGVVPLDLPSLPRPAARLLHGLPVVGDLLGGQDIFAWSSWILVAVASFVVARTPFGLRLRASGSNPKALSQLGRHPDRYRLAAIVISGLACGLAGSSLTLGLSSYVPNVSSGRGWIALVAIYLGGRRAGGVLAACFVFAFADSLANWAQGFLRVPSDFILALPYVITLAALVLGAAWRKYRG